MRVIDKFNSINEIATTICSKARYQKVVICIDEKSDMCFIDKLIDKINKQVVVVKYYYNKGNINSFHNMVNNGARVVVYNVALNHFYKLKTYNRFVLNVFLPQSEFVFPYISNIESVYGDNLLVCNTQSKDYISLLFLYELALNKVWSLLLQNVEEDTSIFKNIDAVVNGKVEFYPTLITLTAGFKNYINDDYQQVEEGQLPYYAYLKLCAILKMLQMLYYDEEQYIDFYKTENSRGSVEKAYNALIKYNITETIKLNSYGLAKIDMAILNRFKIIIKKYFNFKNINLNKLNKIIKNQAKCLNIESLLYISYILNAI